VASPTRLKLVSHSERPTGDLARRRTGFDQCPREVELFTEDLPELAADLADLRLSDVGQADGFINSEIRTSRAPHLRRQRFGQRKLLTS
jgi:hypothetical protein